MRTHVLVPIKLFLFLLSFFPFFGYKAEGAGCRPSSCGNLQNISYPFRLRGDPSQCGDPQYELQCQGNQTVLDLYSHQFNVEEILYATQRIRIKDPSFKKDICSASPHISLLDLPFQNSYDFSQDPKDLYMQPLYVQRIQFLSCPTPVSNSKYKNATFCSNLASSSSSSSASSSSFLYMVSDLPVNKLPELCTIVAKVPVEGVAGTWPKSINLTEVQKILENGFYLSWKEHFLCSDCISNKTKCSVDYDNSVTCYRPYEKTSRDRLKEALKFIPEFVTGIGLIVQSYVYGHRPSEGDNWLVGQNRLVGTLFFIGFVLAVRAVLALPFVAAFLIYKLKTRHIWMDSTVENFLTNFRYESPTRYSYSEVKKMTENFKEKLGQGGYGSVYKGKLSSGRLVAVKMLNDSKGKGQDFINEVATIGMVHHVNIVQLVGFCSEGSKRGLIYDYMQKGSLEKYIFQKEGNETMLSWDMIHDIALGIARGIEYLHKGCYVRILHFDIKPHNILLDKKFVPKVSDFGLAKFYQTQETIVSVTAARGTIGYMAPEFFYKNIGGVSYKSDVYSFGMLLMEMAGRRKNLNDQADSSSQVYFPVWAYDQMDRGGDLGMEEASLDNEKEIVKKLVKVALWCIQMKPSSRPSMSQVVEMLEGNSEALSMPEKPFLSCLQELSSVSAASSYLGGSSSSTCEVHTDSKTPI